jgi:toxin YxiD
MKQLHNQSLHADINQLLTQLDTKLEQMNQLKNAIVELVKNSQSFTGATGDSIRAYYQDIHLPFISFYCISLENYKTLLKEFRDTSLDLEASKNGVIKQEFLEGELTDSLDKTKQKAIDLVEDANNSLNSISDIIHISHLNIEYFTSNMEEAHKVMDDTVVDLINFDSKNNNRLEVVGDDIQVMENYLSDMENQVKKGKLNVTSYVTLQMGYTLGRQSLLTSLDAKVNSNYSPFKSYNKQTFKEATKYNTKVSTENNSVTFSGSGVAYPPYKTIINKDNIIYKASIEDGWDDGIGNANATLGIYKAEKLIKGNMSAAVVDGSKMEKKHDAIKPLVLYYNSSNVIPYSLNAFEKRLNTGQNLGYKTEMGAAKSTFASDDFPLSLDFSFAQAEAKANFENYTANFNAGVTATKLEVKVKPFELFGDDLWEEWFDFDEFDPYVGIDVSLGSAGVGFSTGLENSVYAAWGIGIGVKGGLEKDEN